MKERNTLFIIFLILILLVLGLVVFGLLGPARDDTPEINVITVPPAIEDTNNVPNGAAQPAQE
jgi:hypothetical protein